MNDIRNSPDTGNSIPERSVGGQPGALRPPERDPAGSRDHAPGPRAGDSIHAHVHPPRNAISDAVNQHFSPGEDQDFGMMRNSEVDPNFRTRA